MKISVIGITSLFLVLQLGFLQAQDFYDINTLESIEITFEESNWDQLLDEAYASTGDYILAKAVTINGITFDSVGVKYKGNSTYRPNQTKNPFHLELDTYKEQEYEGYTDIKLSNVAKDPSFLREVLSYQIIRKYMDAPLSNYANVFVNGNLIGLYSNSESISRKFMNNRFNSKNNTFVKCNPPAGAGPGSNDFPNLVYIGEDSTNYYDAYELKSESGWAELIDLCDTLSNHTDVIDEILDVDRALWMLALNNVLVNLDSYIGGFAQNYYLYRDDNGRFVPVIWDLNESFGRFTMTGSGNVNSTAAKQQMSHLLHENDSGFPLIMKLLGIPLYKRMYLAHYKTILLENFEDGSYFATGQLYQDLIDESVQLDNNKFFTYNNFVSNLTTDVAGGGGGPGGGSTVGITNLMEGRTDFILGLTDFLHVQPSIDDIEFSTSTPIIDEMITIVAKVLDEEEVYLGYRSDEYGVFERIQMFDDGMHNDGEVDDNIYGVEILLERAVTQFYIYADNNNIGKFSPERAEHEYHNIIASSINSGTGDIVINEFMASNDITEADQDEEFDDWIEFYNTGSSNLDLEGYFLSDDFEDLMKWSFPAGAIVEADDYLVVWADDDEEQEGYHTNFKLSASGESIFLVDATGAIVDEVSYIDQTADISYGRFPNGTGDFQTMNPTFGAMNSDLTSTNENTELILFNIFPNPTSDKIHCIASEKITSLSIYDASGLNVFTSYPESMEVKLDMENLAVGMYIISAVTEETTSLSQIVIKQ